MTEPVGLTEAGRDLVAEINYGHNPLAYMCAERTDGQPSVAHELCVLCATGLEALTWKRRTVDLRAAMGKLAALMERPPLSERDAGRISERTEALQDAAAMIRVALEAER